MRLTRSPAHAQCLNFAPPPTRYGAAHRWCAHPVSPLLRMRFCPSFSRMRLAPPSQLYNRAFFLRRFCACASLAAPRMRSVSTSPPAMGRPIYFGGGLR